MPFLLFLHSRRAFNTSSIFLISLDALGHDLVEIDGAFRCYESYLGRVDSEGAAPARTSGQSTLANDEQLVEYTVTAAICYRSDRALPKSRTREDSNL
jgi:hypothetical protein